LESNISNQEKARGDIGDKIRNEIDRWLSFLRKSIPKKGVKKIFSANCRNILEN
jgi:hypothetical protein